MNKNININYTIMKIWFKIEFKPLNRKVNVSNNNHE